METISAPTPRAADSVGADSLAQLLEEARARTLRLIAPLTEDDLRTQHDPLMGPILWDLGHIAQFEALWLLRNLDGPVRFGEMPGMFNPFEHPRRTRGELALPSLADTLRMLSEVREQVLARLARLDLPSLGRSPLAGRPARQGIRPDAGHPASSGQARADAESLLRGGYVYAMVAQHEYQHNETMLQTMQLKLGAPYAAPRAYVPPPPAIAVAPGTMTHFPGGEVELGTDDRVVAYDNERPRHAVRLAPFAIDVAPVTNGAYAEFVDAGGYGWREWWSEAGWRWRQEAQVSAPKHWKRRADGWWVRSMDEEGPLDPRRPVCHVCFHEAEAYARFAGKRLPTEAEWEAAAAWDPAAACARPFPWGEEPAAPALANVDQLAFATAPVGSYARNVSPIGCYGMIGDVWEWTASDFVAYPGFEAFPYPEYSEPFFGGEYKVLRGGSWATRPGAIRSTFRNWDYPIRRQIFAGFRCARDA